MPPLSIRPIFQLNCPIVAVMVASTSIRKYGANPLKLHGMRNPLLQQHDTIHTLWQADTLPITTIIAYGP